MYTGNTQNEYCMDTLKKYYESSVLLNPFSRYTSMYVAIYTQYIVHNPPINHSTQSIMFFFAIYTEF